MSGKKLKQQSVHIRPLIRDDIPHLFHSSNSSWHGATIADCLRPHYHSWVLESDGKIIGFIIILLQLDTCELIHIAVHPDYQQQGFGSRLLQHAMQFAKSQHIKSFFLEVRVSNHSAIKLYKKWGAEQLGIRKDYYTNPREDACLFSLPL